MAHRLLILVLGGLVLFPLVSVAQAQGGDVADAQATADAADQSARDAQWRASQANAAARSARATASAIEVQATVKAVEATSAAQIQATAMAVQATTAARATSDALRIKVTQQALSQEATQQAFAHLVEATRQVGNLAATATQQANWAQLDELDLQRVRMQNRIYGVGIPIVALALVLVVVMLVIRVFRSEVIQVKDDVIDVEWHPAGDNGVTAPPRLLLTARIERPCLLRPITKEQSRANRI